MMVFDISVATLFTAEDITSTDDLVQKFNSETDLTAQQSYFIQALEQSFPDFKVKGSKSEEVINRMLSIPNTVLMSVDLLDFDELAQSYSNHFLFGGVSDLDIPFKRAWNDHNLFMDTCYPATKFVNALGIINEKGRKMEADLADGSSTFSDVYSILCNAMELEQHKGLNPVVIFLVPPNFSTIRDRAYYTVDELRRGLDLMENEFEKRPHVIFAVMNRSKES